LYFAAILSKIVSMSKAIPFDVRIKIVRDYESGQSNELISQATGYSIGGIKKNNSSI
jgi:hypothetical protein